MKNIKKMLMLSVLIVLSACINQAKVKIKEEIKMEEKSLDIREMPLQTYEEYVKSNMFMLEKYIKREKRMDGSGVAYLEDGTKIKYSFDDKYISENITNKKYPFIETSKGYYVNTKDIKGIVQTLSDLSIGKEIYYNQSGQIIKIIDHDKEMKALGLNYQKVLEWADKAEIIDLKEAKILKGYAFYINYTAFKEFWNNDWGINDEEFGKVNNLTKREQEKFFNYKYYWIFSVDYERYQKNYLFSADGMFVKDMGKARKMDPIELIQ